MRSWNGLECLMREVDKWHMSYILVSLPMSTQMSSPGLYKRSITICLMKKVAYLLRALSVGILREFSELPCTMNMRIATQKMRFLNGTFLPALLVHNACVKKSVAHWMLLKTFPMERRRKNRVWFLEFGMRTLRL